MPEAAESVLLDGTPRCIRIRACRAREEPRRRCCCISPLRSTSIPSVGSRREEERSEAASTELAPRRVLLCAGLADAKHGCAGSDDEQRRGCSSSCGITGTLSLPASCSDVEQRYDGAHEPTERRLEMTAAEGWEVEDEAISKVASAWETDTAVADAIAAVQPDLTAAAPWTSLAPRCHRARQPRALD